MKHLSKSRLFVIIFLLLLGVFLGAMDPGDAAADFLPLDPGWNFLSLPKLPQSPQSTPTSAPIDDVLPADIKANVLVIWGFDNSLKQWQKWRPSGGDANTLTSFETGKGYWLYLNSAGGSIDITTWPDPPLSIVVPLYPGWNLDGYHGRNGVPLRDSLGEHLDGKWSLVWNWDNGEWSARHSSMGIPVAPLDTFNQAKAYWIKMSSEDSWMQTSFGYQGPISLCTSDMTDLPAGTGGPLDVHDITYCVRGGEGRNLYNYGFVNIYNTGRLVFEDATIEFWAKSILVESGGSMIVGTESHPIGTNNASNVVTIHLYGDESPANQTTISCKTTTGTTTSDTTCGVANDTWKGTPYRQDVSLPGGVYDTFYDYKTLPTDTADDVHGNWFGLKVLAVSYNGSLQMYGKKGALLPTSSGTSWARLDAAAQAGETRLTLDRSVLNDWQPNDKIVLSTTDYLPGHSEVFTISSVDADGKTVNLKESGGLKYTHNGVKYDLAKHNIPAALEISASSVETRAAVALLSRNIRIVSGGSNFGESFPDTGWFGGHTIVRQGFKQYQVQGVEFYQLGQGGRLAHSPVNFHITRTTAANTFVKDCSVWDSMTRWYELRGTQNVLLERNVGFKSIGHGYFLADGVETNNILRGNIGIYARPALDYTDNPRKVPGIFALKGFEGAEFLKYGGDAIHPSVFLITNGYNTFENNMAVGAGACGACYWIAPVATGVLSHGMAWKDYADIQSTTGGTAPLKTFKGNSCSTAQHSLITIEGPGTCKGIQTAYEPDTDALKPVWNEAYGSYYSNYSNSADGLYLSLNKGASYQPRKCVSGQYGMLDCTQNCAKGFTKGCAITAIEDYTSSFHWASTNVSAIWLRTNWFLFTGGALTDVLNGGLAMVSGGSYDQVINGYWGLTRKSVFIGQTQDDNHYFATNAGPVNSGTGLSCVGTGGYCLLRDEGVSFPTENFSVYQRLYNIYDGPVYQEKNAYLRIKETKVDCTDNTGKCDSSIMYGSGTRGVGIPKAKEATADGRISVGDCILPNAAIGWKQPNGFYYPPAFYSRDLHFDDVDLRHFIIIPLFDAGTTQVNATKVRDQYCTYPPGDPRALFASTFTDVDRQTELNDDDGTLSGLRGTISVNNDQFFWVPMRPNECLAEQTCFQVPYDYVTAVVYPDCAVNNACDKWGAVCQDTSCYGVPIYRQLLNKDEPQSAGQSLRMAGAGISQRSTMIYNNGVYYIDTASNAAKQKNTNLSLFEKDKSYNFFLVYAKPTTKVTFQVYVGPGFDKNTNLSLVRVGSKQPDPNADGVVLSRGYPNPGLHFTPGTWPSAWTTNYASGILTVTMDMTGSEFTSEFNTGKQESCKPSSFCAWKDNACKCANDPLNPLTAKCEDAICEWSVKASECPGGGCYGFRVTLPTGFAADDGSAEGTESLHRPAPSNLLDVSRRSDWCPPAWGKVSQSGAGQSSCNYSVDNPPLCPAP